MLRTGARGYLKDRDERILTDLFMTRYLTSYQIAVMHFLRNGGEGEPMEGAADRRMYRLAAKDYVDSHSGPSGQNGARLKLWSLSREGARRELSATGDPALARSYGGAPKWSTAPHLVETNDLYARTAPYLRKELGPPDPADGHRRWRWLPEPRRGYTVRLSDRPFEVRPDAELQLLGVSLFVEYQSPRAHISKKELLEKIDAYKIVAESFRQKDYTEQQLLVVTEDPELARAVDARGRERDFLAMAGALDDMAEHVAMTFVRLS